MTDISNNASIKYFVVDLTTNQSAWQEVKR